MAEVFFSSSSELATLSNTFSVGPTPTDPTAVTLVVTDPLGAPTTYNWPTPADLTHGTPGVFSKDIPCATAGTWQYVWTGTGTASDATAGTWDVFDTALGHLYATVEALKSRMGGLAGTADDYELQAACFAASRAIENDCGRHFWRTTNAEVRTFTPCDLVLLKLPAFNDLVSVTTLKTDTAGDGTYATTLTAGQYQLLPLNPTAAPEPRPYTSIKAIGTNWPYLYGSYGRDDLVQITGVFGWPSVPRAIQQAALILAEDTFKLKDAPFGVQGFGEFGPVRVGTNRAADRFLAPYRRNPVLVA